MNSGSSAVLMDVPNAARAYDYLLGGRTEYLRPDRELAARLEAAFPPGVPGPRDLAVANQVFLQRAVVQAAHSRARQFLVLGAGFPCPRQKVAFAPPLGPLHEAAQAAHPDARVCYVDWDQIVCSHGLDALAREKVRGVTYADPDFTDAGRVRGCPDVARVIDWGQPVTVIFGLVLHFYAAKTAREIIEGYLEKLVPESRIVVTSTSWADPALLERVQAAYGPVQIHNHSATQIMAMLRGMTLLGNGIEQAQVPGDLVGRKVPACVLAGTGLV